MKSRTSVGMRKKERKSGSPIVGLPLQSVEKVRLELGFSDRYGRMGKGDARCWNAGKWIEIW